MWKKCGLGGGKSWREGAGRPGNHPNWWRLRRAARGWGGIGELSSIDGLNAADFGNVGFEISLDSGLERDGGGGAADAGAVHADLHEMVGGEADELDVAAVGLDGGADELDDFGDAFGERAGDA